MPRRLQFYPEKPWKPDPAKWRIYLRAATDALQPAPKDGWQLWDWRTLNDAPQDLAFNNQINNHL
jgi:hypothetical protein